MIVKISGAIAEHVGSSELEINPVKNVADIKQQLLLKAPELNRYRIKVAVNSILSDDSTSLKSEDEVFVFGAYAGG